MARSAEPPNQLNQIPLCHGRAPGRWAIHPAPDMKKNRTAQPRHGRTGIVADFDQPAIGKIVMPHFFPFEPRRRMRRILDGDKPIVIGAVHIVDPSVGRCDLMERVLGAGRELGVVGVNLADTENAGRRATVAFFFLQAGFARAGKTISPSHPILAKQNGKRPGHAFPIVAVLPFKELKVAVHGVPSRPGPHDELGAVWRNAIGTGIAAQGKE
jgi:hypothetical protein